MGGAVRIARSKLTTLAGGLFFAARFSRRSDQKVFEDERAVAAIELAVAIAAKHLRIRSRGGAGLDPDDGVGDAAVRAVEG
jgi:hypothetical protein